jgi:hypothetical protein
LELKSPVKFLSFVSLKTWFMLQQTTFLIDDLKIGVNSKAECVVVGQNNQVLASGGADKNRLCFQAEISQVLQSCSSWKRNVWSFLPMRRIS